MQGSLFQQKLAEGQTAEDAILSRIKQKDPSCYQIQGRHAGEDILCPDKGLRIEIKHQPYARVRLTIELQSDGAPSGILVTTANVWVIVTGNAALDYPYKGFVVLTDVLKEAIKDTKEEHWDLSDHMKVLKGIKMADLAPLCAEIIDVR